MDAMDASLHLRVQLDEALKAGYLNIARARYAMGSSSIGQANYGSVMQAGTYVLTATKHSAEDQPFSLSNRVMQANCGISARHQHLEAANSTRLSDADVDHTSPPESAAQEQVSTKADFLSKEPVQQQQGTSSSDYSSSTIADLAAKFDSNHIQDGRTTQHPAAVSDPLKWFGFMVSPYLRQAQSCFMQAADIAVQLANSQHQVVAATNAFQGHTMHVPEVAIETG